MPANLNKVPSNQKSQLLALTSIRFFLALWVILCHLAAPVAPGLTGWWSYLPYALNAILRGGIAVLDLFFLSSGFILAYHYDLGSSWNRRTILSYGIARFSRLYPLYALGILLMLPFKVNYVVNEWTMEAVFKQVVKFLAVATMMQSWLPQFALTWNYPSWSLSADVFYYLLFPVAGAYLWRQLRTTKAMMIWTLALWIVCMAAPLFAFALNVQGFGRVPSTALVGPGLTYLPVYAGGRNLLEGPFANSEFLSNLLRFNPIFHLAQFLAGVVGSRLYKSLNERKSLLLGRGHLLYLPGLAVTFAVLLAGDVVPFVFLHNGLLLPAFLCLVLGLALGGGVLAKALSWRPLVFLGGSSYSMYLLHAPINAFLSVMVSGFSPQERAESAGWVAINVLVVVFISCFVFKRFEEPSNLWLRKRLNLLFGARAAVTTGRHSSDPTQEQKPDKIVAA